MKSLARLMVLGLMLAAFPAGAVEGGVPALTPEVTIDRGAIRLGDVFAGLPAVADVEIALAPAPGRSVTYDYTVLSKLAERHHLDWQPGSFTDKCVITRAARKITTEAIRTAVLEQLRAHGATGELEIALDNRTLELNLPTDAKAEFNLADFVYDAASQRFRAELLAAVDTPAFQQVAVSGRVVSTVGVPVLARALPQGTILGASDLAWVKMPADRAGDYLRMSEAVVGMELKRQMPEQAPLRVSDVMPARVIKRGALVTMKVMQPGMMLTAQGRALQDGAVGDTIRATNTQSNRVIEARVLASGELQIDLPRRPAGVE